MRQIILALILSLGLVKVHGAPFKTEHVVAELVAAQSAVQAGQTVWVGLKIDHQPHWHTYWRNPGDSGLPTTVSWTLPMGASIGDIEWPVPKRLPVGPLVNYGYEDELILPQRLTVPSSIFPGTKLVLRAQANWLVCKDVCIPESGQLELQLPVVSKSVIPGSTAYTPIFERLQAQAPQPLVGWTTQLQRADRDLLLTLNAPIEQGDTLPVDRSSWPAVHVFPFAEQVLVPAQHEVYRTPSGYAVKLSVMEGATLPEQLSGVVVAQTPADSPPPFSWSGALQKAGEFSASVETVSSLRWPQALPELLRGGPWGSGTGGWSWVWVVGVAMIGGLLLNFMPCVFPVLSIKLLSLSKQSSSPTGRWRHALAYLLGVVSTFLGLAGVLLALRAAGSAVGWGFQLQEPWVVLALAMLFFALGLNLLGAFEWALWLPSGLLNWRTQHPALEAFASGVLMVIAASPCTAPFMGAALGFAVTQPATIAIPVFAALGLGMALPYAALVVLPGWRERLPRPGPWMLHLKQLLAFPMFIAMLWMLWVLAQQVGLDGLVDAAICLLALGFALWVVSVWTSRPGWARSLSVALVVLSLWWAWPLDASRRPSEFAIGSPDSSLPGDLGDVSAWIPYDDAKIASHLANNQPVFVDFTAAWCISCQVNKKLVLETSDAQQAFSSAGVVLMRADWTNREKKITESLTRLGRTGVPVYVLHRPGKTPLLLPEVLTLGLLREALATLGPLK